MRRASVPLLALLAIAIAAAAATTGAQGARPPARAAAAAAAADAVTAADRAASSASSSPASSSSSAADPTPAVDRRRHRRHRRHHRKPKNPYSSPLGLFIQERASKMLPGPGQHFSFGALQPWEDVLALLNEKDASERKLLLLIRHGQAVSNFLGDALGPDEWFGVEGTCQYDPKNGSEPLRVFDADLTALGRDQALALNSMLRGGGWWPRLTGGHAARAVVSPLTRCLNTATLALGGLEEGKPEAGGGGIRATVVEEFVRETLGEDTCDARRSASDPPRSAAASLSSAASLASSSASASSSSEEEEDGSLAKGGGKGKGGGSSSSTKGPCEFERGLRTLFPAYTFDVVEEASNRGTGRGRNATTRTTTTTKTTPAAGADGNTSDGFDADAGDDDDDDPTTRPFGLISDADTLWTKDEREQQKHQVKRARAFLDILFARADERVAVVVTHSGFARSLLLAVEREPYRPVNAELVPVIVDRRVDEEEEDWEEEEELQEVAGGGERVAASAAAAAGVVGAAPAVAAS